MSSFVEIAREFGPWAAMTAVLLVFLATVLYYVKTKIDSWGEPWVKSQIKHVDSATLNMASQTKAMEVQARSMEMQAKSMAQLVKAFEGLASSYASIDKAIEQQTLSNRLVAGGFSQFVDNSRGVTKEHVELIEFNLRKLEEHVRNRNIDAGEDEKPPAKTLPNPKLKMEPLLDEAPTDLRAELDDIQEELKEPDQPEDDQ